MAADGVDALVIFGATGDLAKLETFPALVGLVQRGVLDVPIIGVAKTALRQRHLGSHGGRPPPATSRRLARPGLTKVRPPARALP